MLHSGVETAMLEGTKDLDLINEAIDIASKKVDPRDSIDQKQDDEMRLMTQICKCMTRTFMEGTPHTDWLFEGEVVDAEIPFCVELSNGLELNGTCDGCLEHNNKLVLSEVKSASRLTNDYFYRLIFDKQINGYARGIESVYDELPGQCRYMVFRKPAIRQRKTESIPQFISRLEDDLVARAAWYFVTHLHTFTRLSVDMVMNDMVVQTNDLLAKYKSLGKKGVLDPNNWARNDRACFDYGTCEYFSMCRDVRRYDLYLRGYRMRDIRYNNEKDELDTSIVLGSTRRKVAKKALKQLKKSSVRKKVLKKKVKKRKAK
jgi:hypothetical protein